MNLLNIAAYVAAFAVVSYVVCYVAETFVHLYRTWCQIGQRNIDIDDLEDKLINRIKKMETAIQTIKRKQRGSK